jgi:hypothetical protein
MHNPTTVRTIRPAQPTQPLAGATLIRTPRDSGIFGGWGVRI